LLFRGYFANYIAIPHIWVDRVSAEAVAHDMRNTKGFRAGEHFDLTYGNLSFLLGYDF